MSASMKSAFDRYQHKPFLGSSHNWAINFISTLPRATPILDIGCGSAPIGKALRERGFTSLSAVEVDTESVAHAKQIYQTVVEDLNQLHDSKFGLILLLDVIEHLPDPAKFLDQVKKYLDKNGILLISVPNVAHWSVRIPLLFGYFDYTDRAILDRTHLHFFTRKTFRRLLERDAVWSLKQIGATIEPAEFVLPRFIWDNSLFRIFSRLRLAIANLFPGLMAYQHVAILEKVKD